MSTTSIDVDAAARAALLSAQPRAMRTIDRLLAEGRAHAFMLVGEPGSGPRAAAAHIAAAVLCPAGGGDGCSVCGRVERGVHPDLAWIAPEGMSLAASQVRDVIQTVSRTPFEADAQVIVIEDAETLDDMGSGGAAAGNSLLKVLEEPEGRVVFVLLVRTASRILPTIRSRAIEITLPAVADALLADAVRSAGIDDAALAQVGLDGAMLARAARGDLERALSIATGGAVARRRAAVLAQAIDLAAARARPAELAAVILERAAAADSAATAAATAEFEALLELMDARDSKRFQAKTSDDGMEKRTRRRARRARVLELAACLDELAWFYRDLLAARAGARDAISNVDRAAAIDALAGAPASLHGLLATDAIEEARTRLLTNNADEPVVVGALCAELAGLAEGRVRSRRALGPTATTSAGYDLSLA